MIRTLFVLIASALLFACAGDKTPAWVRGASKARNKWGHYSGYVEARWENDGRTMTLLSELRYTDPDGKVWIAPAGSVVDGASFRRPSWRWLAGLSEGNFGIGQGFTVVPSIKKTGPGPDSNE